MSDENRLGSTLASVFDTLPGGPNEVSWLIVCGALSVVLTARSSVEICGKAVKGC